MSSFSSSSSRRRRHHPLPLSGLTATPEDLRIFDWSLVWYPRGTDKSWATIAQANALWTQESRRDQSGQNGMTRFPSSRRDVLVRLFDAYKGSVKHVGDNFVVLGPSQSRLTGSYLREPCRGEISLLELLTFLLGLAYPAREELQRGVQSERDQEAMSVLERYYRGAAGGLFVYLKMIGVGDDTIPILLVSKEPLSPSACERLRVQSEAPGCGFFEFLAAGEGIGSLAIDLTTPKPGRCVASPSPSPTPDPKDAPSEGMSAGTITLIAVAALAVAGIGFAVWKKKKAVPNRRRSRRRR